MRILLSFAGRVLGGVLIAGAAAAADDPAALPAQLLAMDTALFDAFNACDTAKFAAFLADDIEFYHDKQGLIPRTALMDDFEKTCVRRLKGQQPRVRRELVPGSLETWPLPNFGGIQEGRHRFYEQTAGKPDTLVGTGRFLHVWKRVGDAWKVARIVSYDHKPAP
jgi:hypothetical protein